jgi:predicted  nucleic acid-binding Zn-ribbon protein
MRKPSLGDKVWYICKNCGHRFMESMALLKKCPKCGGHKIEKDKTVAY